MEAAPHDRKQLVRSPTRERLREIALSPPLRGVALSPPLLLLAGCALLATGAGIVASHVTAFTVDESLIEQSAVHYTSNLPHSLLHDVNARASDRLYSLVLSVAFHLFAAANAIRVDHVLSVVLFVSTAAPVYLLASTILRSRWSAACAAALSVAVPWLALTSALYTENLSYPLFWWMMLAACRCLARPSRRRDLLVLTTIGLLIVCRVQFVAVFAGYALALILSAVWWTRASSPGRRVLAAGATLLRRCSFTVAILVMGAAVLIYERASGHWAQHIETLLGSYSDVVVGKSVPPNMVEALGVETIALALGVGLIPALVSICWYLKSIRSSLDQGRRIVLVGCGVILVVFLLLTVFAQLGYLGALTEERYFFYVVPVFWIGALAAIEDRNVSAGEIALCGLVFAALYGAIPFLTSPFGQEIAFLAPVESISAHLYSAHSASLGLGTLTMQDALALLALFAGVLTALIWRYRPALSAWWIAGVATVVQLFFTGYAYATINGEVQGVPGRTAGSVSALGWIDAHAGGGHVWWLDNLPLAGAPVSAAASEAEQRTALFWNSDLTGWATLPASGLPAPTWPLAALANEPALSVQTSSSLLSPSAAARQLPGMMVGATDSPFVQLAGTPVGRSPGHQLTLWRLAHPARLTWLARGLQPTGYVVMGTPVHISAFAASHQARESLRVTLELAPPPAPIPGTSAQTSVTLRLGVLHRSIRLSGSTPRQVSLSLCLPPGRDSISGTLLATRSVSLEGQPVAAVLEHVVTSWAQSGACRRQPRFAAKRA